MAQGSVRVGTSGWVYRHWAGVFYPEDIPQSRWFAHYRTQFDTVEINYSFYRLPSEASFHTWYEQAPPEFLYAIKASRYLTYVKRLLDPAEPVERLLSRARLLGEHLGPILYQLPPRFGVDLARLEALAEVLPPDLSHVLEFRDPSWLIEPVFQLLRARGLSFCIMSMPGLECPLLATSRVVYLRMHGSQAREGGGYSDDELAEWAERVRAFMADGHEVFVYFNNDALGWAIRNARTLLGMLGKSPEG